MFTFIEAFKSDFVCQFDIELLNIINTSRQDYCGLV